MNCPCGIKRLHEHCGCCGREVPRCNGLPWCKDCKKHLNQLNSPAYNQTYFAQFGKPCPFEEIYES